jgi:murein DD-endopeptidase MepM/ murein hydrolase activator NlpD
MQFIVVSGDARRTKSVSLTWRHWAGLGGALLLLFIGFSVLLNYLALRNAAISNQPLIRAIILADQRAEAARNEQYLKDNLNNMALKIGELQAHVARLEGLGNKLAKSAGLSPADMPAPTPNTGRGGPLSSLLPEKKWTVGEFSSQLTDLQKSIDLKTDQLSVLEALLVEDSAQRQFLPSLHPVNQGSYTSNFGYRADPFTGAHTYHEGVDFSADTGTPILAAASGKVITSEVHPGYGKLVEIDHGNGLVTRYAHASRLHVDVGALVVRGQKIAEVGNTGRSTGPHLHFEVRLNGTAQNPARFLARD